VNEGIVGMPGAKRSLEDDAILRQASMCGEVFLP
jgi:hypothetical protein